MKLNKNYSIGQKALFVVLFCCFALSQLSAQLCLGTKVRLSENSDEILVDLYSENFNKILSLQFSMRYDPGVYAFVDYEGSNLPSFSETNFSVNAPNFSANNINGLVGVSWIDPAVIDGATLQPEEVIATFRFKKIIDLSSEFTISNDPIIVEAVNANFDLLDVNFCNDSTSLVSFIDGKFILDDNNNCSQEPEEIELSKQHNWQGWTISATNNGEDFYYSTVQGEGLFQIQLFPGNNTISVIPPNPYYSLCNSSFNIDSDQIDLGSVLQIFAQIETYCPLMSVDIITPPIEACAESFVFINYGNYGTQLAEDAYIEVALDQQITIISSTLEYTSLDNGIIRFELGEVAVGNNGFISIETAIDCEVEDGETLCNEVQVFPNEFCGELDNSWSGASLKVRGQCFGEEIIFEIENVGNGDMTEPAEFIVIEDAIIFKTHTIQLEQGAKEQVTLAANGATYRVQVEQVEGHPGISKPTAFVEGCGINQNGGFSKGFVQVFSNDEADLFVSIDCQQVGQAFDPSTLNAIPRGIGTERFINSDDYIEYQIFFQETADQIVILDTLSSMLDLTTFQPIASSKPYLYQISDAGIVQFIVPSSSPDFLSFSNDFIQFKIRPKEGIPNGSKITNTANIYAGLRPPSQTNSVFHTVGENFLTPITSTYDLYKHPSLLSVSPNPSYGKEVAFQLAEFVNLSNQPMTLTVFNSLGHLVHQTAFNNQGTKLNANTLDAGIYFFQLSNGVQFIDAGSFSIIK